MNFYAGHECFKSRAPGEIELWVPHSGRDFVFAVRVGYEALQKQEKGSKSGKAITPFPCRTKAWITQKATAWFI
jgi:hypothetical protein